MNCHSMVTVPIEADCSMDAWGIVYNSALGKCVPNAACEYEPSKELHLDLISAAIVKIIVQTLYALAGTVN